jgi:antirestriction protein ArdC
MTACLLLSESGITPDMANSASYVEWWLSHWKDKKQYLYRACRDAQKACEYILANAHWWNDVPKLETAT